MAFKLQLFCLYIYMYIYVYIYTSCTYRTMCIAVIVMEDETGTVAMATRTALLARTTADRPDSRGYLQVLCAHSTARDRLCQYVYRVAGSRVQTKPCYAALARTLVTKVPNVWGNTHRHLIDTLTPLFVPVCLARTSILSVRYECGMSL